MGLLSTFITAAAEKAEEKAKATLVPKSGWGSRKLWIFAGIAFALIWLGRGNLVVILDGLIYLTGVYLITQAAHDCVADIAAAWVKRQQIRSEADVEIEKMKHPVVMCSGATITQQ
jgi:hypothetical protein